MCLAMAMYPVAKRARVTAMTMNAAGMPVSPVVAYALGMTPAATVSGATPARMKASTAGMPSRSRASALDIALGGAGAACVDTMRLLVEWWCGVSGAVRQHGAVDGGLGLADST